jgi:hypothetical protein
MRSATEAALYRRSNMCVCLCVTASVSGNSGICTVSCDSLSRKYSLINVRKCTETKLTYPTIEYSLIINCMRR